MAAGINEAASNESERWPVNITRFCLNAGFDTLTGPQHHHEHGVEDGCTNSSRPLDVAVW